MSLETTVDLSMVTSFDPIQHQTLITLSYNDEKNEILGCEHYQRKCKIRAPCCADFYNCRLCHDAKADHEINRHAIKEMVCMSCVNKGIYNIQPVASSCKICNTSMARYYCDICKLFDDDPDHDIFHCTDCGICRRGIQEEYFHCKPCNTCYVLKYKDNHKCMEHKLESDCPICLEKLFTSVVPVVFMPCGHPIHQHCLEGYMKSGHIICMICKKSIAKSEILDRYIEHILQTNPMPAEYSNQIATILCNDCVKQSDVPLHFMYMKCPHCSSFNTNLIKKYESQTQENTQT